MKKTQFISLVIGIIVMSASCHHGNTIINNNGSVYVEINYEGEITFNDDETSIQSITPDGFLKYRRNDKRLFAQSNYHGEISYELYEGGKKLNINDDYGKKFLANAIKELIANGFDAKGRLERIYRKGGNKAVLNEVSHIDNDFVKGIYFDFLLSADSLSHDDMIEIAKKIRSQIGSDFEKGKLLNKFAGNYSKDSLLTAAYLDAATSIGSDFDKSNALKNILRQPLPDNQLDQVLGVSNTIGSDFDKVNIIKEVIDKKTSASGNFDKIFDAIAGIGSDFDRKNLLVQLIDKGVATDKNFDKMLGMINHINSDFDKVNLLMDLIKNNNQSEEQWISLINATALISSPFDKSNLLVKIAEKMPQNENIKSSYLKAAKTINSDMDYGRVVKAVQ